MGIIPGRPYHTQSDGDDYAMCVFGHLSVTPLHCVVDMRVAPENIVLFSFAEYPAASGLRSRSDYFGGVGCCGELH